MVEELVSGLSVALEIRAQNAQAVFREFCGPHDPVNNVLTFFISIKFS